MRTCSPLIVGSLSLFSLACTMPPTGENEDGTSSPADDDRGEPDDDGQEDEGAEGGSTTSTSGMSTSGASLGGETTSNVSTTATSNTSNSTSTTSDSNTNGSTSGGDTGNDCTDIPPDDRETCATWREWGECDSEWMLGFCEATCGRCTGGSSTSDGMSSDTSPNMSSTTGELGDDNPFPPINGGSEGWASRYWDCCKPSCGWSGNASNPVISCDQSDNSLGVTDARNACEGGGTAHTCHRMAPWAYSNVVSFGFAAVNGVGCGTCFQLEFTGQSHNAGADPGSQALAGKTMVVMATNIGNIGQGQFDILIPGGGVGEFNACSDQWGVSNDELGAQYGGFLMQCKEQNGGDYNASRECVRSKCESVFGSRGLDELYDGCMWFVDWFESADNPQFRYQQIDCPSELYAAAH